ncbi:hypothetical protein ABIC65_000860 [Sphingomonas trueperi]|uniref:hypothetical protein n=1 Tax=Sphingomonas trueperi TaxID=53317 RepID=UPI00339356B2
MKKLMSVLAVAGTAAALFGSAPAAAQSVYLYPSFFNDDPKYVVTISDINWSGSYYPRIEGTVQPGKQQDGTYKTVGSDSYGSFSFKANITKENGVTQTCYYSVTIGYRGDVTVGSARWTSLPACSAERYGSVVIFRMNSTSQD